MKPIYFATSSRGACGVCSEWTISVVGQSEDKIKHHACPTHRLEVGARLTGKPIEELELVNTGTKVKVAGPEIVDIPIAYPA